MKFDNRFYLLIVVGIILYIAFLITEYEGKISIDEMFLDL
jgi:hypothetical protein